MLVIDEFKVTGAMFQRGQRVWGERGFSLYVNTFS